MLCRSLFAAAPWWLGVAGHLPIGSQVLDGDAPLSQKGGGHGLWPWLGGSLLPSPRGVIPKRGGDTRVPPLCVVAEGSRGTPSKGFSWRLSSTGRDAGGELPRRGKRSPSGGFSPRGREWGAHPAGNRQPPCPTEKGESPPGTRQKPLFLRLNHTIPLPWKSTRTFRPAKGAFPAPLSISCNGQAGNIHRTNLPLFVKIRFFRQNAQVFPAAGQEKQAS